jgi:hypothetical protein
VRVDHDAGLLRLPEDLGQPDHRQRPGGQQVAQDLPGADGRQLVHVAHQQQVRAGRDGLDELAGQDHVHHRGLVHHHQVDFPVVCIRDGAVIGWHNDITGASALAVAGSPVALFGGYGPDYDRLALTELGADRVQPAGEYRVVLSDGEPLPAGTEVIGRGSRLHFLTGTSWYQLDMDDIPA